VEEPSLCTEPEELTAGSGTRGTDVMQHMLVSAPGTGETATVARSGFLGISSAGQGPAPRGGALEVCPPSS
jgi:hypothetical protein